ncbi:MAG TPA: hypothetical protein VGA61_18545, partial [Anaerolineae bacterium]
MSIERAKDKFNQARNRAIREDLLARLRGAPDELLPYEAVVQALQAHRQGTRPELQAIPLDRIVGSVGRYHDFTRHFLPRTGIDVDRWTSIDVALDTMEGLPPIEAYEIGNVYFVSDGNHRVSVARANGLSTIDAYVTTIEPEVAVALEPGDTLDAVIIKAEAARFTAETGLDRGTGSREIVCSRPGGYPELLDHIAVHRYFMSIDHPEAPAPDLREAAADWYARVYQPIVEAIDRRGLLARFPGMTAADLYVWISARILRYHEEWGQQLSAEEAAAKV